MGGGGAAQIPVIVCWTKSDTGVLSSQKRHWEILLEI